MVDDELSQCNDALENAKDEEDQHRNELDHLSQEVESAKLASTPDPKGFGKEVSEGKTVLRDLKSTSPSPLPSSRSPSDLASLRRRRNIHWEAVHRLLSRRNELQIRSTQLRLMQICLQDCLTLQNQGGHGGSDISFSLICHKCRGTLLL
jgi:hypothetical protein